MKTKTGKMLLELIIWNWWKVGLILFAIGVTFSAIKINFSGVSIEKSQVKIPSVKAGGK